MDAPGGLLAEVVRLMGWHQASHLIGWAVLQAVLPDSQLRSLLGSDVPSPRTPQRYRREIRGLMLELRDAGVEVPGTPEAFIVALLTDVCQRVRQA